MVQSVTAARVGFLSRELPQAAGEAKKRESREKKKWFKIPGVIGYSVGFSFNYVAMWIIIQPPKNNSKKNSLHK